MPAFIHRISAALFYILGATFFIAVWMLRNAVNPVSSEWWLRIADLPLLLLGMLYGGLSVFQSLRTRDHPSHPMIFFIGLPLLALFLFFVILNFWGTSP